jgi:hypothetical protein
MIQTRTLLSVLLIVATDLRGWITAGSRSQRSFAPLASELRARRDAWLPRYVYLSIY